MDDFSAVGGGQTDAAPALQRALDRRGEIRVPPGTYRLGATLKLHSDTDLIAEPGAVFVLADGVGRHCRDFMLTNANPGNGNRNISVRGGVWQANNAGNPRGIDFEPFSYTGAALNFVNTRGLTLSGLTVQNPEAFFILLGEVRDFLVEDIDLDAGLLRPNQDGVHLGGYCEHGIIRRIRATGPGVPNDDMVALNADDNVERQLNLGMRRGPIRDITIEDIEAEDAYTFVRLLSVDQPIEDIRIRRLRGGCRVHGINLNNWAFPKGVGAIRRVLLEDIDLAKTAYSAQTPALVKISLRVDALEIRRLHRRPKTHAEVQTLLIDNNQRLAVDLDGRQALVEPGALFASQATTFGRVRLDEL